MIVHFEHDAFFYFEDIGWKMIIFKALLYPGTLVCRRMGIDPERDQGLIRAMSNMLIYLIVILSFMWALM